jgi:hypothetical protein
VHIFRRIDGDTSSMSWTERDGQAVCAPQRRGFGTIVPETMAETRDGALDLIVRPGAPNGRLT